MHHFAQSHFLWCLKIQHIRKQLFTSLGFSLFWWEYFPEVGSVSLIGTGAEIFPSDCLVKVVMKETWQCRAGKLHSDISCFQYWKQGMKIKSSIFKMNNQIFFQTIHNVFVKLRYNISYPTPKYFEIEEGLILYGKQSRLQLDHIANTGKLSHAPGHKIPEVKGFLRNSLSKQHFLWSLIGDWRLDSIRHLVEQSL